MVTFFYVFPLPSWRRLTERQQRTCVGLHLPPVLSVGDYLHRRRGTDHHTAQHHSLVFKTDEACPYTYVVTLPLFGVPNQVERAYDCIRKAAKHGHLEVVAWLSSSREWNPSAAFRDRWAAATTAAMDDAAARGHLKVSSVRGKGGGQRATDAGGEC